MDAAEFLRTINRMNDNNGGFTIYLCNERSIAGYRLPIIPERDIDDIVRCVEKWAKEHPVGCDRNCIECGKCYNEYWQSQEKEER